jgi:hypothetical protein
MRAAVGYDGAMPRYLALLAALVIAPVACKTPEEKLLDRRHELRALLDRIHDRYDREGGEAGAGTGEGGLLGRLASGVERSYFERYCLAVGRGERPFSLSARLEDFMREGRQVADCREAAEIDTRIAALEREVAERAGR